MCTEKIKDKNVDEKEVKVTKKVDNDKNKKQSKKKLDDVLGKVDASRTVALERRTSVVKKSLKGKKIKAFNVNLEEQKLDRQYEKEDNLPVAMMVLILVSCFVIGGILGYMLYRIALNSSNALLVIQHFLK